MTGAVTHSGGTTTIDGTLTASSYAMSAGTIGGGGTLTAPLSTTGAVTVSPSGTLDVTGTVSLDGAAVFTSSIASSSSADQHHSTGPLTLTDAVLQVTFTGTPSSLVTADTIMIASSGVDLTGTFSNAPEGSRINSTNNLANFEVNYTPTAVILTNIDHAPVFTGSTAFSIAENASIGALLGTVIATDEGAVSYSLSASSPFTIDSASGQITTTSSLDFETQSQYTLTATASDGALSTDATISIEVTNVLEDNLEVVTHYLTRAGGPFEGETDPAMIGINADPDDDGIANVFELWFGSDPSTSDVAPSESVLKVVDVAGSDFGGLEVSVVVELDDVLAIDAEASFDLNVWRSTSSSRSVLSEASGRRTLQFTDSVALPPSGKRFFFRFSADPSSPNPSL